MYALASAVSSIEVTVASMNLKQGLDAYYGHTTMYVYFHRLLCGEHLYVKWQLGDVTECSLY